MTPTPRVALVDGVPMSGLFAEAPRRIAMAYGAVDAILGPRAYEATDSTMEAS